MKSFLDFIKIGHTKASEHELRKSFYQTFIVKAWFLLAAIVYKEYTLRRYLHTVSLYLAENALLQGIFALQLSSKNLIFGPC